MQNTLNPRLWVQAHADYLYAFAISRINDEETARDLVQDTFLAALSKVTAFEGKSTERTWLTAILKNKIVDVYRKKSSGLKRTGFDQAEPANDAFFEEEGHWRAEQAPVAFGIEHKDHIVNREFEQVLEQCLKKLPTLWKSVFTMKHIDEEPTDTICTELQITSSNFWVIIHRAKVNLRACLQKNWI